MKIAGEDPLTVYYAREEQEQQKAQASDNIQQTSQSSEASSAQQTNNPNKSTGKFTDLVTKGDEERKTKRCDSFTDQVQQQESLSSNIGI